MVDGILLIDKNAGPTSHDVVNSIRRILKQKRVGHCGTLDPAATGLLMILLGRATRLAPWLQKTEKAYEGAIRLGRATDTYDAQGEITAKKACKIKPAQLTGAAKSLTGEYLQMPPAYSAIKVNGRPAYAVARKGGQVDLKTRTVTITEFQAQIVEPGDYPLIDFKVTCSSGTYIRALAVDLGAKVNCLAHLESLRRLRVGKFSVNESISVAQLTAMNEGERRQKIVSVREATDFAEVFPNIDDLAVARNGVEVVAKAKERLCFDPNNCAELVVKIVDSGSGDLLGLGNIKKIFVKTDEVLVKPFLVLASN